ncbi:MAG TPA: hypothetical protein PLJ78_03850 [Anaerolineae bacterium]|nr:hypothetical protein [Anaerolineae bacterium]HQK13063.1 hypothetical protein [Anaerolineae bacterium]
MTVTPLTLQARERELKKRWAYPYRWGRVQNDLFDAQTRFVYDEPSFEPLLAELKRRFEAAPERDALFDYALNRWYNFWSARAVEEILAALDGVTPAENRRDRLVDFTLYGVRFDHKTSVFPRGFAHDLTYAVNHPAELIEWLYREQSREQRRHYANRLFLVLYAADGAHWKLKAELTWLGGILRDYVATFDVARLHRFTFVPGQETLSDIIWAIRC